MKVGVRIADNVLPTKPGQYARINRQNGEIDWMGIPPKEGMPAGTFLKNSVTEHDDGAITVAVLLTYNKNYPQYPQWRGYLREGVWIEESDAS